jgi:hypothetical protein
MTPIIVTTHTEGVVRVYHRQPDGTLHQTGRFVAEQIDPPALAQLVAALADTLHWDNGAPLPEFAPTPPPPVPVKVKTKPKGDHRRRSRAGQTETQRRRDDVLTHLAKGDATAPEIAETLFAHLPDPVGKARKTLGQLEDRGLVTRLPAPHGTPMRFHAKGRKP